MAERANSLVKFKQRTPFAEQFEGVKPEKYVGVKSIPIDKGLYELCQFHSFEGEEPVPSSIPRQLTVDKLQFRSSFKPEGEYLLIDGLGRGEHQHFDTAAITCYTAMGYKFLFDADYLCKKTSDHSIMNISKGGRSNKKIPSYAGLSHSVEFKDAAFTSLFVPDYRGIDWTRNIYWEKEKFFVVIDSLRAKHKDDYLFNCTWKVLDRGLEKYDGKNLICRAPKEKSGDQAGNIKIDPIREFDEQVFHLKNTERKGYWDHRTSSHQIPSHRIHQTRKETMKEGDYISFQNIFYVERKANRGEHVNYTPYRLNERAMLIDADNNRLLMIDDGSWKKFNLKGKFVSISRENLLGVSVTSFYKNNDRILSSNVPVDIRIKNGEIKIESDKQGKCYLFDIDESFHFNKGVTTYSDISFDLPVIGEGLKPKKQDKSQDFDSELSKTYKNFEIIWQGDETDFEYSSGTSLVIDDITNDNNDEVIVTSKTGQVDAYNIKGELLWEYSCPQGVYSAAVGDLNQDGEKEVFLGTGSHSIVVIDKKGRKIRELQIPLESSGRLGKRTQDPQWITVLDVRDLTDNGKMELIIGTRTWLVQIYDNEFNRIRYFAPFEHGVKELDYSDMDNDGFEEILVADGYGSTRIIEWQGDTDSPCVRNFTTVGNVSVDWTDVNKDGLKQMLNASGGMLVSFSRPDELQTKIEKSWDPHYGYNRMWKFNNYGYAYTDIAVLRQNTQSELVLVASENGYIYCLDAVDGRQKWKKYLGSPVRCILIEDNKIFAGTEKGWVFSLDSEGQILKDAKLGGRIEKVKALSNGKICVMDTYGQVFLLK
jgi:outer membrane protein assembly factor BamB